MFRCGLAFDFAKMSEQAVAPAAGDAAEEEPSAQSASTVPQLLVTGIACVDIMIDVPTFPTEDVEMRASKTRKWVQLWAKHLMTPTTILVLVAGAVVVMQRTLLQLLVIYPNITLKLVLLAV